MPQVHLIGNAHIDPVWLWRWQDGFSETLATFRSAIDRLREFPDTFFTSACAVYYQWVEETDPAMFEEIRALVQAGRWNIVGGWPLQPDCNIPDGEGFMRHALYGGRYFKEKFGVTVKTGYNVDSFGHTAGLPKILRASGIENYVFMRPNNTEHGRDENLFWWESDDGSRVCAFRIPFAYGHDCTNIEDKARAIKQHETENTDVIRFYDVAGEQTDVAFTLCGETLITRLDPYAVKTIDTNGNTLNAMEWVVTE